MNKEMLKKHQFQNVKIISFSNSAVQRLKCIFASKFIKCRSKFVCFAPSPTGPFTYWSRTALFNYFAKKIMVFSFTNRRYRPKSFCSRCRSLYYGSVREGIPPDETIAKNEKFGPYRQRKGKPLYREYADQLINSGWAYYAFDSG
jgi:glutamyl-tRNA synthetase